MSTALFTGFPGFLGARLLPRLLDLQPELTVVCLVQPRFMEVARLEITSLEKRHRKLRGRRRRWKATSPLPGSGWRERRRPACAID
jgi:thioester reductase-like protein